MNIFDLPGKCWKCGGAGYVFQEFVRLPGQTNLATWPLMKKCDACKNPQAFAPPKGVLVE